jgi:hypothetical protein
LGLKIAVADVDEEKLKVVGEELRESIGAQNVLIVPTDVSKLDQVVRLKEKVYDTWGEVSRWVLFLLFGMKGLEVGMCWLGCGVDE